MEVRVVQHILFPRERIIDAAFELIREIGWKGLSTRTLAKRIGCSTMPIYSHVKSTSELEDELRAKAVGLLMEYQGRPYTENVLMNMAIGYVVFARDEKQLFRFLYLEKVGQVVSGELTGMKEHFSANYSEGSEQMEALTGIPQDKQELLMQHSWIHTHGLAMLVNSGVLTDCSNATISRYISHAGAAFYLMALQGEENNE
jgi:AcrR family transcriptional regulator